jgi:hypothetical protein
MDKEISEWVSEFNEEALFADGFEDAFVGVIERFGQDPIAVYDREKCIAILMEQFDDDNDEERDLHGEAEDYFGYNVIGAWVGEGTPAFITRYEKE